jgi:hypothetical protein
VITAARVHGCCGVGIDCNPYWIRECHENAGLAGVSERVCFSNEDLFEADISKATVVSLFLLDSVNRRLRPKLIRELKPGARIISHRFDMSDWLPDHELQVEECPVYCWVVPAKAAGTWECREWHRGVPRSYVLHLDQHFQEVTGILRSASAEAPITDAMVRGDLLEFTIAPDTAPFSMPVRFSGRIDDNFIHGQVTMAPEGMTPERMMWSARRVL